MSPTIRRRALRLLAALLPALLLLLALTAPAGAAGWLQDEVKATYLYRFLDYTEWPPDTFAGPGAPITIGVLGSDDVGNALKQLTAAGGGNGRLVMVRRVVEADPLEGLQVLYIDGTQRARAAELARASQRRGLLVVTDWEGALDQGAALNFVLRERRVRFEVSLPAAERAGIRFSARMLAVASYVRAGLQ
jgi:hypothetical protein